MECGDAMVTINDEINGSAGVQSMKNIIVSPHKYGGFIQRWLVLIITMLFYLNAVGETCAAGGDLVWQRGDLQSGTQEAQISVVDHQGNVVLTGYRNLAGDTNDDFYTVKFKADGSGVAWSAFFDRAGGSDKATAIVVDANNDVIVTGLAWNGSNRDIHTIKYDGASGAVLWQHTWNGPANGNDFATAVGVDSLNNVYVGGSSQNVAGNEDFIVIKYGPTGPGPDSTAAWETTYNGAANGTDQLISLAVGVDGLAVTGESWNGTSYDMTTVKLGLNGVKAWERRYSSGTGFICSGKQIKMDAGGNVIVTGTAANGMDYDIYTAKYNAATGTVAWNKTFNGAFDDEPFGLYVDGGGDVYVTGYTWTLSGTNDFCTLRYAGSNGAMVWQQLFDSGNGNTDVAVATGIVVDESGDVFVTGYTVTSGNYDFQTIKYKRDNGNQLWHSSFNGAAGKNDRPVGIGLSPAGDVLVGGWSDNGTDLDYYLLKYDAGSLNAPTGLTTTTVSNTSVQLGWTDNSGNEDGFKIERKLGAQGAYSQIATVGPGVTTFLDTDLVTNNYYYYRVRAYNAASGDSHYSDEARALTIFVNFIAPSWSYLYNNADGLDDFANAISVGPDNNPVVTGYSLRTAGGFDYYTLKLDRLDKSIIWSHLYDDADSEMDVAKCVAVDRQNNAIVSGYSQLFYPPAQKNINSIYTLKYPPTGPPETWHSQYNGPGAIDDRATAIATTTDGADNIVVIGYGKNAAGNEDIYVVRYPASPALDGLGNAIQSWAAVPFDGGGDDIPSAVAVAADGSVFVTGYSETATNSNIYTMFTAKYNGTTGALIWSDRYSATPGGDNRGNSLAIDGVGNVYVTGSATTGSGTRDIYTIKYSGSGTTVQRLWERQVSGASAGDDEAVSVGIDPIDGAVIIAGTTLTAAGDRDITLIRYGAAGDLVWQKTLLRPANDDQAVAMAVDFSGYIYVAGNTSNGQTVDVMSLIYDHQGALLAATVFNGAANGNDEASSIAVNYKGEAFIAGSSANAGENADYLVIKQTNNFILVPAPFMASRPQDYSKINLAWGNNTPGTGFRIERTLGPVTTSSVWTLINTAAAGTVSFQDSGLNAYTNYCYRIEAFNGSIASRKIITCATTSLATPVLTAATAVSATAIDVTWGNVSGNTGYKLERKTGAAGTFTQLGGQLPANTVIYHDTGLTAGTTYYYRLTAVNGTESSLLSNTLAGVTLLSAPVLNAPTGVTASGINLSWTSIIGNTGYKLERSTDNSNWVQIAAPAQNTTTYPDSGLASGTTYYYRLIAVNASGDSAPGNVQSATTRLRTPSMTSAVGASNFQMTVAWTDVNGLASANETGIAVEYAPCTYDTAAQCTDANGVYWGSWLSTAAAADSTSLTIGNLTAGRTYRVRVTATLSGANSVPSAPIAGTTTAFAQPVINPLTVLSATAIDVTWDNIPGNAGYKIERKTGAGGAYSQVGGNLPADTTVHHSTGLNAGTTYYYRVSLLNSVGTSNEQGAVTLPAAPTQYTPGGISTSEINLSWTNVTGNAGYKVERSQDNLNWTQIGTPATNVTSFRDTGLIPGATYFYRIRATNPSGDSSYSNTQQATTTLLTPALNSATAVSATQIALGWSDPNGEASVNETGVIIDYALCANFDPVSCGNVNGAYWGAWSQLNLPADSTATTVTGLLAGRSYRFRVVATLTNANSAPSTMLAATTNLQGPVGLTATVTSSSSITITWPDVAGETSYRLEQNGTIISELTLAQNTTSHTLTGLALNVPYCFRVQPNNSTSSAFSNQACATIYGPTTLNSATAASATVVTLGWTDVSGETGYEVWQSAASSQNSPPASPGTGSWNAYVNLTPTPLAVDSTSFPVATGLTPGYTYKYKIRYQLPDTGFSAYSNEMQVTTVPPIPTGLAASGVVTSALNLTWTDGVGETGYNVQAKTRVGASCATEDWTGITSSTVAVNTAFFPVTGLTPGFTYCFRINAFNGSGTAAWSPVITETTLLPAPVLNALSGITQMNIDLSWNNIIGNAGYLIERSTDSINWSQLAVVGIDTTAYSDSTVVPNQMYYYRLAARNSAGVYSTMSTVQSGQTQAVPSPALNPLTGITQSSIELSWSPVAGNSGYKIERSINNATWTQIALPAADVISYSDTGLEPNRLYYYRVSTKNSGGYWSAPGNVASATTQAIAVPSLNMPTGVTHTTLNLSWSNVAGNLGYKLERSTDNVTWVQLALPGVDVVAYSDMNLVPNRLYYYRISTKNSGGYWSLPSTVVSATTTAVMVPALGAPSGITTNQITINWGDVSGNIGYKVERSTNGSTWSQIATPLQGVTSYTNISLSPGTLYYYRVSAKMVNTTLFTAPSAVQSVTTTPASPSLSLELISESRIDLRWQVVYGATNYKIMRSLGSTGPWSQIDDVAVSYSTLYCGYYPTPTVGCPTPVAAYTTYGDTGLTENSQYCYQLAAWNGTGGNSALSTIRCMKTPSVGAPTVTAVTAQNSAKIKVDWSYNPASCSPVPCEDPDGFQVWRLLPSGEMGLVATVPNTGSYLDITAIEPRKTYAYRVRAYKGGDVSPFSNTMEATTPSFVATDGTCP